MSIVLRSRKSICCPKTTSDMNIAMATDFTRFECLSKMIVGAESHP
jgi:hypothetical protein